MEVRSWGESWVWAGHMGGEREEWKKKEKKSNVLLMKRLNMFVAATPLLLWRAVLISSSQSWQIKSLWYNPSRIHNLESSPRHMTNTAVFSQIHLRRGEINLLKLQSVMLRRNKVAGRGHMSKFVPTEVSFHSHTLFGELMPFLQAPPPCCICAHLLDLLASNLGQKPLKSRTVGWVHSFLEIDSFKTWRRFSGKRQNTFKEPQRSPADRRQAKDSSS